VRTSRNRAVARAAPLALDPTSHGSSRRAAARCGRNNDLELSSDEMRKLLDQTAQAAHESAIGRTRRSSATSSADCRESTTLTEDAAVVRSATS